MPIPNSKAPGHCCPPPLDCGGAATEFRDDLSRQEYTINGLCQKCQDSVFGHDEEGAKMWTLETALPFLREIEKAVPAFGYHTALAGSVLYQGYSSNDLDIHVYERGDKTTTSQPTLVRSWFHEQGWSLTPCANYEGAFQVWQAMKGSQAINVFFLRKL